MIHLGQTDDGRLLIASNQPLPSKIKCVEYYREQKLFTFSFEDPNDDDIILPYEVSEKSAEIIEISPNVIIIVTAPEGHERQEYLCPLIQVGT
jgi:hypothetical protein